MDVEEVAACPAAVDGLTRGCGSRLVTPMLFTPESPDAVDILDVLPWEATDSDRTCDRGTGGGRRPVEAALLLMLNALMLSLPQHVFSSS